MTSPKNPYSPFKKKITGKASSRTKSSSGHELMVVGFPPTMIELYSYTKLVSGSAKENFSYPFRMNFDSDDPAYDFPVLESNGFIGYYYMRQSLDSNERKSGVDGFPRYMLVRCVPEGNPSSAQTRKEGLNVLESFFKHKKTSKFPPTQIRTADLTADPPKALNEYVLDKDIFILLGNIFEEEVLNRDFVSTFPEISRVIFRGPSYPEEAVSRLGFGHIHTSTSSGSYAPGFFPVGNSSPVVKGEIMDDGSKKDDFEAIEKTENSTLEEAENLSKKTIDESASTENNETLNHDEEESKSHGVQDVDLSNHVASEESSDKKRSREQKPERIKSPRTSSKRMKK